MAVLSDQSELVSDWQGFAGLGGKLPPFGQRDLPVLLEPVAVVEVSFEIEVIVDGGMDGGELLQTSHSSKPKHGPFSSSKGQVAVLGPIIEPPPDILFVLIANDFHGGFVRAKPVGDDDFWVAVSLHGLAQKLQRSMAIPALCDIRLQHFTLVIDCAPEEVCDAVYPHENLVQMTLPLGLGAQPVCTSFSNLSGEHRSETVPREPHHLVTEIDASLVEQILDVP